MSGPPGQGERLLFTYGQGNPARGAEFPVKAGRFFVFLKLFPGQDKGSTSTGNKRPDGDR